MKREKWRAILILGIILFLFAFDSDEMHPSFAFGVGFNNLKLTAEKFVILGIDSGYDLFVGLHDGVFNGLLQGDTTLQQMDMDASAILLIIDALN